MRAGISGGAARRKARRAGDVPSALRRGSAREREVASNARRGLEFAREVESAGRRSALHAREMPFDGRRTPFHGGKTSWYMRRGPFHALNLGFCARHAQLYGDEASGTPRNPAGEFALVNMRISSMRRKSSAGSSTGARWGRDRARDEGLARDPSGWQGRSRAEAHQGSKAAWGARPRLSESTVLGSLPGCDSLPDPVPRFRAATGCTLWQMIERLRTAVQTVARTRKTGCRHGP